MYALRYLERTETGRRIVLSTLVSLCVKFVTLLLYSAPPSPESLISEGVENLFLYAFILTLVLPISDCSGLILFRYRREYLSWTLSDFCYEVVVLWWYLAHVNFFFWLMDYYVDMWGSQDRQKKKTLAKEQFSIAMEKRPIRARPEWFFHACLYGHNSVIRKIFKENPYFDVNQTVRSNVRMKHLYSLYFYSMNASIVAVALPAGSDGVARGRGRWSGIGSAALVG